MFISGMAYVGLDLVGSGTCQFIVDGSISRAIRLIGFVRGMNIIMLGDDQ